MASAKCSGGGSASSSAIGIKIPLSELFGSEATSEPPKLTVPSAYKLIDECPSKKKIRTKKSYVMSYNENTKNAEWVYEILNKDTLAKKDIAKGKFSDYSKVAGYTRGHLAAASNHGWCQEAYDETFLFSNISPQCAELNKHMMNALEKWCQETVTDQILNVHVYTGPIITANSAIQRRNASEKVVPDSFFKVIIKENRNGTVSEPIGYLITNDETTLVKDAEDKVKHAMPIDEFVQTKYKKSVRDIESISGLKFCETNVRVVNEENRSVTWTGENAKGESRTVHIKVRVGKQLQGGSC
nr:endonuclease G, mitochondrial-like [Danio rerio]XP_021328279.1 endonuclease G, mitochondrial-like [Danio rerio]|eukprot:XP_017210191.1 endonuclease G, mitochondrial-like [Danio rerio]